MPSPFLEYFFLERPLNRGTNGKIFPRTGKPAALAFSTSLIGFVAPSRSFEVSIGWWFSTAGGTGG